MKTYLIISLLASFACTNSRGQANISARSSNYFAVQSFTSHNSYSYLPMSGFVQDAGQRAAEKPNQPVEANRETGRFGKINDFALNTLGLPNNIPPAHYLRNDYAPASHLNNWKLTATTVTLTGIALVARSLPYFLKAIRAKAGLRFCCQKTTYGSFNKARKKVTGITFAIPIGK